MTAAFVLNELLSMANPEKAAFLQRFFKTGPGQYAEGDVFLGLVVPLTRNIAKANKQTPLSELQLLMESEYHEARLCALLIVAEQFKKATETERKELYEFYLKNARRINNWDLVDVTCPHVVGAYLLDKDRSRLYELAESDNLWEQRIAMVSTISFIRNREYADTLALAELLMTHKHDLMHKAVGWMLREIGKKDRETLTEFLEQYATRLPRTALRYAIEHYPEEQRQYFLKKK
ncbi:DNA alkylation repair protein [Parabacteroides sp. AM08-6]|uniref:DNA alkylation repair protein n=1 Tax=Parabacteroides sp. AM08-6 TaxID=2292053 RepID=UPI000EFDF863|nr:DNA alkylation repair protein [Parabacteroides sp. AM08-6]RHJ77014.1 DNA alkylation repair protein [Parabacteroides sp. AM08-6]